MMVYEYREETIATHNELRRILEEAGCPEIGDVLIDEICVLFGYEGTTEE